MKQLHTIEPVYDKKSRVLILGSFPSVKSREAGFFYGHPRNRFWSVLARVTGSETPVTVEEKKKFLLDNRIALWDVIASCDIEGSADSSIRDCVPNEISSILNACDIRAIYVNGNAAAKLYDRFILPSVGRQAVALPSTSPANAAWSLERLVGAWSVIASSI